MRVGLFLLGVVSALHGQTDSARYDALAERLAAAPGRAARDRILAENATSVNIELRRALIGVANPLALRNELEAAQRVYEIACEVSARSGDAAGQAGCSYNVGLMLARRHREDEAVPLFEDALRKYAALNDHKYQGRVLNNLSIVYAHRHEYGRFFELAERALEHKRQAGDPKEELNARITIAVASHRLGRYDRAVEHLTATLDLARSIPWEKSIADALQNLGAVYYDLGDGDLALRYALECVQVREKLDDKRDFADSLDLLGIAYARTGDLGRARETLDRAEQEALRGKDDEALIGVRFHQGNLLFTLREHGLAREKLQAAMEAARSIRREWLLHQSAVSLGEIAVAGSRWEDAVALAVPALEFARRGAEPNLLRRASVVLADALARLGRAGEIEALLRAAVDATESLRDAIAAAPETARRFMEDKADAYGRLVELLERQGRHEEALAVAERARSRVVLQILRSGNVQPGRALTEAERQRESELLARIAGLRQEGDRAALDRAVVEHRAFKNELYGRHPELRVQRLDTDPVAPSDLVARLPEPGAALLEYVVGPGSVTLFVVTAEEGRAVVRGFALPITAQKLEASVRRFRDSIAGRDLAFADSARALYRALIEPAAAQLGGRKSLVIVPDRILWELPFQALIGPRGQYLVEEASISYAPSLTVLAEMLRARKPRSGESRVLSVGAAPLASVRREATGVAEIYGPGRTDVFLGPDAGEQQIRAGAPHAGVIHLAAHGVFRDRNPMSSFLRVAREGKPEAGRVEARDMMNLHLNAEMVVLSGCETARGTAEAGEGLVGMSWALFVAGAPATIASQWKVDAASTAELMLRFHRGVRVSGRKARALQAAALAVMKRPEYRHPFYWAGFVVIGDGF